MKPARPTTWLWRSIVAAVMGYAATARAEVAPVTPDATSSGAQMADDGYAAFRAGDMKAAAERFLDAIESGGLSAQQTRTVTLGLSDALMGLGRGREAVQALSLLGDDTSFDVLSRRAFALDAAGDRPAAARAYAAAAQAGVTPEQRTMMWRGVAYAAVASGDRTATQGALARLQGDPNLSRTDALNMAYAALKFGDDARAQTFFAQADRLQPLDGSAALDAGYSAKRLGEDAAAVRYFRQGLASAVHGRALDGRDPVRREVADLSRRGGVTASLFYDGGETQSARLPGAGQGSLQAGVEAYWRPLGWNGGRPIEPFVRAFQTLDATGGDPVGGESLQGWIGVRAKPLATQNLVVEGSRLVKLGSASRNDWMVRASYSTSAGLDIAPQRRAPMFHVFVDAAQLLESNQTLALADARVGRSFRFDQGRTILAPFVGAYGSYDDTLARESAWSVGPGLWARRWFRGDAFKAPQSYVDMTLQYRLRVAGDRRGEGLFASFSVSY